ncbi:outer membrane protein assembly factor BamC [Limnohabitans sp. 2KL-27]|uniref:outer membrane protein assembly factor BamC n=1 Tax=Limnohabitans sp. 2KL-27 TaxID=1100705 RepID=UPI001E4096E4|nr:outer membrane protein assembly factor BamC [Limnohabitans sp. 2KL-27]
MPLFSTSCQTVQRTALVAALAISVSACSILEEDKVDYKSAAKAPTLEIPPDLSQLRRDSRYAMESNSATASGFQSAGARVADAGTAANSLGDVRLERQGNQRWLVVARPADKVWEPLKEFWTSNGFVLTTDSPDVGIMETDWAENRAKIPQDLIRRTLGKMLDSLYSTGERDKFRTRVERNAQGGVEIYITHRGMAENYTSSQKEQTIWQPRASDPELEIEFLRRLMVKLGASPEAAKTAAAGATPVQAATVTTLDGQATIQINDTLDRAWRRTGVALDRTGFTVEDRDRSKGVYFVRYVTPGTTGDQEPGFLARMFSSKKEQVALSRYRIALTDNGSTSFVRVQNANGQPETSGNAERILKLLANELR